MADCNEDEASNEHFYYSKNRLSISSYSSSNSNILSSSPSFSHTTLSYTPSSSSLSSLSLSSSSAAAAASIASSSSLSSSGRGNGQLAKYLCLNTLKGHVGMVSSLAVAEGMIYSASQGNDIRSWPHHPYLQHSTCFGKGDGTVKALLVKGNAVFAAHQDNSIRVWKRSSGKRSSSNSIHPEEGEHKLVASLPTISDRLLNCLLPKSYVEVRRERKRLWMQHVDAVSSLALSQTHLYSASWDRSFKVWRLSDFKCTESVVRAHDDAINAILFHPQSHHLYTASADCKIKVWCLQSINKKKKKKHSLVATLEGHESPINAIAFTSPSPPPLSSLSSLSPSSPPPSLSPNSPPTSSSPSSSDLHLFSASSDGSILGWDDSLKLVMTLKAHRQAVLCLTVVRDILFSGSADKTIKVWKIMKKTNSLKCLCVLEGHTGPVKCISVSDNLASGCLVYTGSADKTVKIWWVSPSPSTPSSNEADESDESYRDILSFPSLQ